jgi:thioredoxin-like negative regulator of GroEL
MSTATESKTAPEEDGDADALLASLEEEDDSKYRAQRLQELKAEASTSGQSAGAKSSASYLTLKDDDETLRFTTEYERTVVHFFHPDFARCATMDQHCQEVASKHNELGNADLAFGRVDVKNAPFVVEKLGIRVLPCVLGFVNGVAKGRVTGFEGISWEGKEHGTSVTAALEAKMVEWTVLRKKLIENGDDTDDEEDAREQKESGRRGLSGIKHAVDDEDDDWD